MMLSDQMDPGSLVSVMAVLFVVGLLQVRARAAEKARDGKAALEKKLQELRVKKMNENLPEDALNSLQKQVGDVWIYRLLGCCGFLVYMIDFANNPNRGACT